MALFGYLKSTILCKIVMAVTGVIVVGFVTVHTIGNMQIFIGKETFNNYAHFLQSLGELLWIFRIVLFLSVVLHIITSVRLYFLNNAAKPEKYRVKNYIKAKLTSRTMIWTGIMIFAFVTYHILHFTVGVTDPQNYGHQEYFTKDVQLGVKAPVGEVTLEEGEYIISDAGKIVYNRHDVYYMVIKGFQQPLIAIIYIIGVILMGFHFNHAIQSMFQTLGLNHPKYNCFFRGIGPVLATIIVLCLISIPISILFGLVGGSV